ELLLACALDLTAACAAVRHGPGRRSAAWTVPPQQPEPDLRLPRHAAMAVAIPILRAEPACFAWRDVRRAGHPRPHRNRRRGRGHGDARLHAPRPGSGAVCAANSRGTTDV